MRLQSISRGSQKTIICSNTVDVLKRHLDVATHCNTLATLCNTLYLESHLYVPPIASQMFSKDIYMQQHSRCSQKTFNTLQHACNTLQHTVFTGTSKCASNRMVDVLKRHLYVATHCNTLATHCNTLATLCNTLYVESHLNVPPIA